MLQRLSWAKNAARLHYEISHHPLRGEVSRFSARQRIQRSSGSQRMAGRLGRSSSNLGLGANGRGLFFIERSDQSRWPKNPTTPKNTAMAAIMM